MPEKELYLCGEYRNHPIPHCCEEDCSDKKQRNTSRYTNQLGKFLVCWEHDVDGLTPVAAAMPSLHFGYSLIIGLTLVTLPLGVLRSQSLRKSSTPSLHQSIQRTIGLICRVFGVLYPLTIFVVVLATANHFVLDAIIGGCICVLACRYNRVMLNLRVIEDCVLFVLRISKPRPGDEWCSRDILEAAI